MVKHAILGLAALVLAGGAAFASVGSGLPPLARDKQEQDKEQTKRKILQEVEKRLDQERDRVLKEIEKVIDEELARSKGAPARPPQPAPAPAPKVVRGYLGVRPMDLSEDEKKQLGVRNGVRILEVVEEAPAAKAGVSADDILVAVDGKPIEASQDLFKAVGEAGAGKSLKLEIVRAGKKQELSVTLARHPEEPAEPGPATPEPKKAEAPKAEDPAAKAPELRERVKKFLQKEEQEPKPAPKAEAPRPAPKPAPKPAPQEGEDLFAIDEDMMEMFRGVFEQFGMDPEQLFEKGNDGKYRLVEPYSELLKGFDLKRFTKEFEQFFKSAPGEEEAPKPAPKKPAPRPAPKAEAKPAPSPWLGVQIEEVPEEIRKQLSLEEGLGLLVGEVTPGGPCEKAGLKKNDILVKIDDRPLKGEDALATFMQSAKIGQEVTLTLLRKTKEETLKVTLGERKE